MDKRIASSGVGRKGLFEYGGEFARLDVDLLSLVGVAPFMVASGEAAEALIRLVVAIEVEGVSDVE